jgi:regulator of protease activity HflC (stomatin/prohibitin superfamily)
LIHYYTVVKYSEYLKYLNIFNKFDESGNYKKSIFILGEQNMFGIRFAHFDSMMHVIVYKNGKICRQGRGLSFYYFAPTTSIVAIPVASNSLPFIFPEITKDYQSVTVQGQVTYRIDKPEQLANILNFTVNRFGQWKTNDLEKLNQTITNESQTAVSAFIHELGLKEAIRSAKNIEEHIVDGLRKSHTLEMLGIDILNVNVLAVQATSEMTRALETETREKLQQNADQAVFERRNFAVEKERMIKESELNTEIAVVEKQKQIAEKKMEAKIQEAENDQKLREMHVEADIAVENRRQTLIEKKSENDRKDADTKSYVLDAVLKPCREIDWRTLMALEGNNSNLRVHLALAFRTLAENAEKIGNLNITPDLLEMFLSDKSVKPDRSDKKEIRK